ncbi:MAG: type II toxin-antitoxin system RelE/ParE family toxin [Parcubacteria group bacterium]|nr:type II toxin-antitoxin system RelE/ParE family toxin [Parcubacteria group bacterium]
MNEEESNFTASFLESVEEFIQQQSLADQAKIAAATTVMMKGDFHLLYIKTLKSPIKELIIKQHRIVFFSEKNTIYFIGAFIKKTAKTPKSQIDQAEKIYKMLTQK